MAHSFRRSDCATAEEIAVVAYGLCGSEIQPPKRFHVRSGQQLHSDGAKQEHLYHTSVPNYSQNFCRG